MKRLLNAPGPVVEDVHKAPPCAQSKLAASAVNPLLLRTLVECLPSRLG